MKPHGKTRRLIGKISGELDGAAITAQKKFLSRRASHLPFTSRREGWLANAHKIIKCYLVVYVTRFSSIVVMNGTFIVITVISRVKHRNR